MTDFTSMTDLEIEQWAVRNGLAPDSIGLYSYHDFPHLGKATPAECLTGEEWHPCSPDKLHLVVAIAEKFKDLLWELRLVTGGYWAALWKVVDDAREPAREAEDKNKPGRALLIACCMEQEATKQRNSNEQDKDI